MNELLSRTPPVVGSLEPSGFKRVRSNSISGRLRSASELFDDGKITNQQKGVLKDLIIAGDPKLNEVLQKIDTGDQSAVKGLLNRKQSIDIFGDIGDTFDFLSVGQNNDGGSGVGSLGSHGRTGSTPKDGVFSMDHDDLDFQYHGDNGGESGSFDLNHVKPIPVSSMSRESPSNGAMSFGTPLPELFEFNLFDDHQVANHSFRQRGLSVSSVSGLLGFRGSARDLFQHPGRGVHRDSISLTGDDLDLLPGNNSDASLKGPIVEDSKTGTGRTKREKASRGGRNKSTTSAPIGIPGRSNRNVAGLRIPKDLVKQKSGGRESTPKGSRRGGSSDKARGSGRGRSTKATPTSVQEDDEPSIQDPEDTLAAEIDDDVIRVGAYSPDSRRARIEKFLQKRQHRIWKKRVKYDVRKNFADSRLRVKGRFVKKEDEEVLRDIMMML